MFTEVHQNFLRKYRKFRIFDIVTFVVVGLVWVLLVRHESYYLPFLFLAPGLLLSLMYAPYLRLEVEETDCCNFHTRLAVSAFFAGLTSWILCVGLSAVVGSIYYLFDIDMPKRLYVDIWILGGTLFAPFYFLSALPRHFCFSEEEYYSYPSGIKFIVSYIFSPLLILYTAVLYAYIAKITIMWELPKGNLAYMITGFGVIGVLTHLLAYPLREEGHALLRLVCRYFYHALIVPVLLLGLGIWVRIDQYGVTESRYAIGMAAVWLGLSAVYMVATKYDKLKVIPLFLSILFIAASFGPWGAVSTSTYSQVGRLKTVLEQNGILIDGKIQQIKTRLALDEEKDISSMVRYLLKTDKETYIRPWFPEDSAINKRTKHQYKDAQNVMKDMGLTYVSKWQRNKDKDFISVNATKPSYGNGIAVALSGYDYFIDFGYSSIRNGTWFRQIVLVDAGLVNEYLKVDIADMRMVVTSSNGQAISFDLANLFSQTWGAKIDMEAENNGFHVLLSVKNAEGKLTKTGYKLSGINFALLVDE